MIGGRLLHYRIDSELGHGGMGVVYHAFDTKLNRPVAIKVLPHDIEANSARKLRFVQEARAASALNHPHIITIHDINTADDVDFIVMEYVPGKSLDRLIPRRGLPLGEVLRYAIQIADALVAAHAAGIVHRDLKPANIMVTEQGHVKVLDFGVAKLVEPNEGESEATRTAQQTKTGAIVGTPAYMSPEQAEGKAVDSRSDIFSFGVVLYEMVTGRRPFQGETSMATLSALLHTEPPPISEVAEGAPRELERVINSCLRKDRKRRLQHMDDVKIVLEELKADSDSGKLAASVDRMPAPQRRRGWLLVAAAVLVAAGTAAVVWFARPREFSTAPAPLIRLTADTGLSTDPALSPDGKFVAYASDRAGTGNLDIWVKQVDSGDPLRLTSEAPDEYEPSFSPDGNRLVFRSERDGGGIYTIPTLGGQPRLLAPAGREPRYSPDGTRIAFVTGGGGLSGGSRGGLFVVPASGGTPQPLVSAAIGAAKPAWSPDGKFILFATGVFRPDNWGIVSAEAGAQTAPIVLPLHEFKNTGLADIVPYEWTPQNRILFVAKSGDSSHLFEVGISPPGVASNQFRLDASPKRLTSGTEQDERPSLASGPGARRLAFASLARGEHIWGLNLDTNQPATTGQAQLITQESGFQIFPSISRNGTKLAFLSHAAYNDEVWLLDLRSGQRLLLSNKVSAKQKPTIHADGTRITWADVAEKGSLSVSSSGGVPERLCECGWIWDWSPDYRRLLHFQLKSSVSTALLDIDTGKKSVLLERAGANVYNTRWSPDREWIVFQVASDGSHSRLYVAPFANDQRIDESDWISISDGSGVDELPNWSPDGNWIYAISNQDGFDCIWAFPVDARSKKPRGKAVAVFHSHGSRLSLHNANGVSRTIAVATDRIVFNQGEITGNIWMTEIPR